MKQKQLEARKIETAVNQNTRGKKLAILIKRINGIPMEEALRKADEAGLVIASNKRISKAPFGSDEYGRISDGLGCWSGTMAAYDKPEKKLGKVIEYKSEKGIRYVFPVPREHQGKKNIILVAEHPDFSLVKDGKDRIIQAITVDAVAGFPTSNRGWFLGDTRHGIPQGDNVDDTDQDATHLCCRIEKRVGLIALSGFYEDFDFWGGSHGYRRDLVLDGRPSERFGVVVEAQE